MTRKELRSTARCSLPVIRVSVSPTPMKRPSPHPPPSSDSRFATSFIDGGSVIVAISMRCLRDDETTVPRLWEHRGCSWQSRQQLHDFDGRVDRHCGSSHRAPSASAEPGDPREACSRITSKRSGVASLYISQSPLAPRTDASSPDEFSNWVRTAAQNAAGVIAVAQSSNPTYPGRQPGPTVFANKRR
jgi:hypothetical protein